MKPSNEGNGKWWAIWSVFLISGAICTLTEENIFSYEFNEVLHSISWNYGLLLEVHKLHILKISETISKPSDGGKSSLFIEGPTRI